MKNSNFTPRPSEGEAKGLIKPQNSPTACCVDECGVREEIRYERKSIVSVDIVDGLVLHHAPDDVYHLSS